MSHGVLDVVAEHPQEHHVRREMDHVGMQEHVGDERQRLWNGQGVERPAHGLGDGVRLQELGRDDREARTDGQAEARKLKQVDDDVYGNDADGHPLVADEPQRVVVGEGNEEQVSNSLVDTASMLARPSIGGPALTATRTSRHGLRHLRWLPCRLPGQRPLPTFRRDCPPVVGKCQSDVASPSRSARPNVAPWQGAPPVRTRRREDAFAPDAETSPRYLVSASQRAKGILFAAEHREIPHEAHCFRRTCPRHARLPRPVAGSALAQTKMDCSRLYKDFWEKFDREKFAKISAEQLSGVSRWLSVPTMHARLATSWMQRRSSTV